MTDREYDGDDRHTIGDMNGRWQLAFKLALASYPFMLTWCIWVTSETLSNRFFRQSGDRFTTVMASELNHSLSAECVQRVNDVRVSLHATISALERRVNMLPPDEWRARVMVLEKNSEELKIALAEMRADLRYIKQAVGTGEMH